MIKQLSWKVAWFLVGFPLFRFWMRNDRMRNWFAWNSPSVRSSNFFCKCEVAVVKVWNAFDGHYHRYHLATFLIKPFTVREFARKTRARHRHDFPRERKLMISVIKLGISWNGKRRLRGAFHFRPELRSPTTTPHFPSLRAAETLLVSCQRK